MNFLTKSAYCYRNTLVRFSSVIACAVFISCGSETAVPDTKQPSVMDVPFGFPAIPAPQDNPLTLEKIELGRHLFYDKRLSLDQTLACVDCHKQEFAFTDGLPVSRGVNGEHGGRNSPTIVNTSYQTAFFFDGRASTLEEQIHGALFSPVEMYADEGKVTEILQADSYYKTQFSTAFGKDSLPNSRLAIKALASFVRIVLSGDSRYDRFLQGQTSALTMMELRGRDLFFSEQTQCASCHNGFNFTDDKFHSTGLYLHYYDKGRALVTNQAKDVGTFKTPTLRNCGVTAPYMHDGSVATLEEVIEHYDHGGKAFVNKDKRIVPLKLSSDDKQALVAFLHTLTDETLLKRKEFKKP